MSCSLGRFLTSTLTAGFAGVLVFAGAGFALGLALALAFGADLTEAETVTLAGVFFVGMRQQIVPSLKLTSPKGGYTEIG